MQRRDFVSELVILFLDCVTTPIIYLDHYVSEPIAHVQSTDTRNVDRWTE